MVAGEGQENLGTRSSSSTKKIDDLFICNEFSSISANKQTPPWMSLGGFHGLMLQKKITQNDYKIVTIFN